MFGRRRKTVKMPAEMILTATSTASIDPGVLTQLQSRSHSLTPAHKALLASSLHHVPTEDRIMLAQASLRNGHRAHIAAGGQGAAEIRSAASLGDGPTLEDQLDAGLAGTGSSLDSLIAVFERQHWPYQVQGDALITVAEGLPVLFVVDEEYSIIRLFLPMVPGRGTDGYVPIRPEAELSAAVYLLAADYRLPYGAFTRDNRDGEIRYEASLLAADAAVTDDQIAGMMVFAVAALAQHAQTIIELLKGQVSLRQALSRLDGPSRGQDIQIA